MDNNESRGRKERRCWMMDGICISHSRYIILSMHGWQETAYPIGVMGRYGAYGIGYYVLALEQL